MDRQPCARCRVYRTAFLAAVAGLVAGLAAHQLGAAPRLSMAATFFGALVPVMLYTRR